MALRLLNSFPTKVRTTNGKEYTTKPSIEGTKIYVEGYKRPIKVKQITKIQYKDIFMEVDWE